MGKALNSRLNSAMGQAVFTAFDLEWRMSTFVTSDAGVRIPLATTRRRLVAYPEALAAVLHTARALRRSPDTVSVRM
jgi:hypothetical protein